MRSISPGTLILGIFAVLFGLAGAYAVKKHLQAGAPEVVEPTTTTRSVPLAVTDLPAGRTLPVGDVTVAHVTEAQLERMPLPDSYMGKAAEIVGRTLREAVKKGQAFDPVVFYPVGIGPSVADRLEPGQRAVTIPFDGSTADAGLITPGAIVDVLFRSFADDQQQLPEATVTLLENVNVLAVGRETFEGAVGGGAKAKTVTLAVAPEQAHALKVVEGRGSLTLVLRGGDDDASADAPAPTTLSELLGIQEPKKPLATEIYRRGQLTTVVHHEGQLKAIRPSGPYDTPIVGQPQVASSRVVLTSSRTPTPAPATDAKEKAPCPCGKSQVATLQPVPEQRRVGASEKSTIANN
jgi:pilus assembly protein CpaB